MPIKQLTDSKSLSIVKRGVPIVGDFRKGEEKDEKGRWGKDLEDGSWRVTFREGYEMFADVFQELFKDTREPFVIATIDHNPDDVFNDYYRLYGSNGMAQIVCDGENIQYHAENKTACMDCIVKREEAKNAKDKAKFCVPNAYFRFTIPKFNRALQMPVPFLFQFSVTSITELQHIKKELQTAYEQKTTLINELFLLYRNNRRFNRAGSANDKSLAYVLWLDKNLDEKAQAVQLKLESGDYAQATTAPQLTDAIPDGELSAPSQAAQASLKQKYIDTVTDWVERRFDMDMEAFLFQCGSFMSIEQLMERFPEIETLENHVIHELCVKRRKLVKIYGVRTEKFRNTVRMIIPFGMGIIHSYTRSDFGEHEAAAKSGYVMDGVEHNIANVGDHAFKNAFGIEFLSMELGLTDTGNLKIVKITGDLPF